MKYIKMTFFSLILGYIYYILTIAMMGIAAANRIFWWVEWPYNLHLLHIGQNFIGIGLASLIPAYLVHSYEHDNKWIVIIAVILSSMLFLGNINYMFIDPNGLVRFFKNSIYHGDIGSYGLVLEMIVLPVLWLYVLKRITSR
jgi:hypothetical protein